MKRRYRITPARTVLRQAHTRIHSAAWASAGDLLPGRHASFLGAPGRCARLSTAHFRPAARMLSAPMLASAELSLEQHRSHAAGLEFWTSVRLSSHMWWAIFGKSRTRLRRSLRVRFGAFTEAPLTLAQLLSPDARALICDDMEDTLGGYVGISILADILNGGTARMYGRTWR